MGLTNFGGNRQLLEVISLEKTYFECLSHSCYLFVAIHFMRSALQIILSSILICYNLNTCTGIRHSKVSILFSNSTQVNLATWKFAEKWRSNGWHQAQLKWSKNVVAHNFHTSFYSLGRFSFFCVCGFYLMKLSELLYNIARM
ncbi:hypothetical protein QQ045_024623 [Rhodiola kirilowii]